MTNSSTKKRVLSGMRSTGKLHLGNYVGALQNWVRMQDEYDCFFFIADWHALTTDYADTSRLKENSIEVLLDWLAAGLDPEKCVMFIQSHVPEHAELHLLFSMITPLGWLERVPTYKEQKENIKGKDLDTYGFLGYPVLQSADILIYKANVVPVGEDQVEIRDVVADALVALAGDMNSWTPSEAFTPVGGTNLFFLSREYEMDARLDYKFVVNDKDWIFDPMNPRRLEGGVGANSFFAMPGYVPPPEFEPGPSLRHGAIQSFSFASRILGNERQAKIYLPWGYGESRERYRTLYVLDGTDYLNLGKINEIVDAMIESREIPPVIMVLVPALDRNKEYLGNADFARAFATELVPAIDEVVDGLIWMIKKFGELDKMTHGLLSWVLIFGGIALGITASVLALGKMIEVVKALQLLEKGEIVIQTMLDALKGPQGWVALGVAAAVGGATYYAYSQSQNDSSGAREAGNNIRQGAQTFRDSVQQFAAAMPTSSWAQIAVNEIGQGMSAETYAFLCEQRSQGAVG